MKISGRDRPDASPVTRDDANDGSERTEYSSPKIKRWGTVRDLTRGDAGVFMDFPGTRKDT